MKALNMVLNITIAILICVGINSCIFNSDDKKDDCNCKKISYRWGTDGLATTEETSITCTSRLKSESKLGQTVSLYDYDGFGRYQTIWQIYCK